MRPGGRAPSIMDGMIPEAICSLDGLSKKTTVIEVARDQAGHLLWAEPFAYSCAHEWGETIIKDYVTYDVLRSRVYYYNEVVTVHTTLKVAETQLGHRDDVLNSYEHDDEDGEEMASVEMVDLEALCAFVRGYFRALQGAGARGDKDGPFVDEKLFRDASDVVSKLVPMMYPLTEEVTRGALERLYKALYGKCPL